MKSLESLLIKYSSVINDNSYEIDLKNNIIYINPVFNDVKSVSSALCEYLGYNINDYDAFLKRYRDTIIQFLDEL